MTRNNFRQQIITIIEPKNKIKRLLPHLRLIAFVCAIQFLITACVEEEEPAATPEYARVSLYHTAPNTEGINIVVNASRIGDNPFRFGDYVKFSNLDPGQVNMKFLESNTGVIELIDTIFTFEVDRNYSIFLTNTSENLEAVFFEDIFPYQQRRNESMVRFIHMSPDAPPVSVLANEDELFQKTIFKGATEFISIKSGMTTFELIDENTSNMIIQLSEEELSEGVYYNVILSGFEKPPVGNINDLRVDLIRL